MDAIDKPTNRPIEILLVEDNPGDVRLTVEALKDSKLLNRLHIVSDGVEAIQFLRRHGRYHNAVRPDVILLDLNLPRKSGHEVLAEIKSDPDLRNIPVTIVTTSESDTDVQRAYESYANCYITKPVDFSRFMQVVQGFEDFWINIVKLPRVTENRALGVVRVLVVEDNAGDARLITEWLESGPAVFEVEHVGNLAAAQTRIHVGRTDVVLLDLGLPDSTGIETLQRIRQAAPQLPVIVLSGLDDQDLAIRAVRAGAQDFLTKGVHTEELLRRSLRYSMERKRTEERLDFLATHDDYTGLANRNLLMENLRQAIAHSGRHKRYAALLILDIDNLKRINDTLGHSFGDEIIRSTAQRLSGCVRQGDTVGRLGGDEFCVLLADLAYEADVSLVAQKIMQAMNQAFAIGQEELRMTVSIGGALCPQNGTEPEVLLKNADVALYRAKQAGKNGYQLYSKEMNERAHERLALEGALHVALERGEFILHYQPVVNVADGSTVAHEALLRWQHPQRGLLPPADFIPITEETGLIVPIGAWVMETACVQNQAWNRRLRMAVNLSARQVSQLDFVTTTLATLARLKFTPSQLELEITESLLNDEAAALKLQTLKEAGVRLAVDDFGTGYSSFVYLRRFPIDTLKIDRSFVAGIGQDARDEAIVLTVIEMAHRLGMTVTAEGVETEAQWQYLRTHGCDFAQGYYFSRPLAALDAGRLLPST